MPDYTVESESNTAAVTSSASGVVTFTVKKLKQVQFAIMSVAGYVAVVTGVSGQTITAQLYQTGSAVSSPLTAPTAAVTIPIGGLSVIEFGI